MSGLLKNPPIREDGLRASFARLDPQGEREFTAVVETSSQ
jgi:hypothetical protein